MREELYVIVNGERKQLDLDTPSGITLSFKSTIFDDLSKITASYSYTFQLPITTHNRRMLDNAEDIRSDSSMIRRRLKCEFVQNGIPLFNNANLYIESVETSYNAVMTWNDVSGFAQLQDDDISLNELTNGGVEVMSGTAAKAKDTMATSFDNEAAYLYPCYDAGLPYRLWTIRAGDSTTGRIQQPDRFSGAYPMPVVPAKKLVDIINAHYGTRFHLGSHIDGSNLAKVDPKLKSVELGCVPIVNLNLTEAQIDRRGIEFQLMMFTSVNKTVSLDENTSVEFKDIITFNSATKDLTDFMEIGSYTMGEPKSTGGTVYRKVGVQPMIEGISIGVNGYVTIEFDLTTKPQNEDAPVLTIYQYQPYYKKESINGRSVSRKVRRWVEMASCDGEYLRKTFYGHLEYEFNFDVDNGGEVLTCSDCGATGSGPLMFVFSHKILRITNNPHIRFDVVDVSKCYEPHSIDVMSNLPDISCLTFMKCLFFMIGAFPAVDLDGNIIPHFFSDIEDNLKKRNTLDWSKKLIGDYHSQAIKTSYVSGSYAQRNRYLMKSDQSDEKNEEKDSSDVYAKGVGEIFVANKTLSRVKKVIQLPFYAPYIKNRKHPKYATGDTMKCWEIGNSANSERVPDTIYRRLEFIEPKACYGIISDREIYVNRDGGTQTLYSSTMSMEVWNGFVNITSNPSYQYLQRIVNKPYVITENFMLNEFDLRDLDYSVPVYLDKYNAFFAVISITRDTKGVSKCELIKLP